MSLISDGFQCGNFTKKNQGQYCKKFLLNYSDCYGTSKIKKVQKKRFAAFHFHNILGQDCRNFPELCSPDASCVDTGKKVFKDWERW